MNARRSTDRIERPPWRYREGLSESDRYWLGALREAPVPMQMRVAAAAQSALAALLAQGVLQAQHGMQYEDARCALVATLFRFFAHQQDAQA
jgi:hypothetical protein